MDAHRIETIIPENGTLTLKDLPFKPGTYLEIIVLECAVAETKNAAEQELTGEWLQASKRTLQEVWDNDEDAVYDISPGLKRPVSNSK